jgi:hypothetical protein
MDQNSLAGGKAAARHAIIRIGNALTRSAKASEPQMEQ